MERLVRLMTRYSLPEPDQFETKSDDIEFKLTCRWIDKKTWLEIFSNKIVVINRNTENKFNDLNLAVRNLTNYI